MKSCSGNKIMAETLPEQAVIIITDLQFVSIPGENQNNNLYFKVTVQTKNNQQSLSDIPRP